MSTSLGAILREQYGVSRRDFLKFCSVLASSMAISPTLIPRIAEALEKTPRQSVIWLSFQECTGCTESLTRSHAPTLESLILEQISLDYHHTLQAAAGDAAERARDFPSFPSATWECRLDRVAVCIYTRCNASKNVFPSNASQPLS